MLPIPENISVQFNDALRQRAIPEPIHVHYRKWLRFFLDFCKKYPPPEAKSEWVRLFIEKLKSKKQTPQQCSQAAHAISLFFELQQVKSRAPSGAVNVQRTTASKASSVNARNSNLATGGIEPTLRPLTAIAEPGATFGSLEPSSETYTKKSACYEKVVSCPEAQLSSCPASGSAGLGGKRYNEWRCLEKSKSPAWDQAIEKLAAEIKIRHYSRKTLKTYGDWGRKFQQFLSDKPPEELSSLDVKEYLTYLAVKRRVASSTQNQAFNALLFLFRHVLNKDYGDMRDVPRAKKSKYIPVVLSRQEIDILLSHLEYPFDRVVGLLYGCGLRLFECLGLRVQNFNFDDGILTVHGKGDKDRTIPLPKKLIPKLETQLEKVRELHDKDLAVGYGGVFLPDALEKKYPAAAKEFIWQWFFPQKGLTPIPGTKENRRYHLHESQAQEALKNAARRAKLTKRVKSHTFRHSFATHLLQAGYDIRTIQTMLGHTDVRTTMIYTHCIPSKTAKELKSPLDF